MVGRDAGATDVGADWLQAPLDARPPPSVEHVRSREGVRSGYQWVPRIGRTQSATTLPRSARVGLGSPARGGSLKTYPTPKIRNVALVGHAGAGKTTLAEALLFRAGAITRAGRVEDGTTVCDFEPEEHKRASRPVAGAGPVRVGRPQDQPHRHPGLRRLHRRRPRRAAGGRPRGVRGQRGRRRRGADRGDLADRRGAGPAPHDLHQQARPGAGQLRAHPRRAPARFGAGIAPLELPIGEEAAFRGVADLLTDTGFFYDGRARTPRAEIPDELAALEHEVHDNLVEGIVVADDDLLERYLEGDVPSPEELEHTLGGRRRRGAASSRSCAARPRRKWPIDRLADFICEIGPSPADRPGIAVTAGDDRRRTSRPTPDGQPLAFVFKTIADPYVGQLSLFKVLSGTVKPDDHLVNPRTGADERLHALFTLRGKDQDPVTSVPAGDIAAVAKLSATAHRRHARAEGHAGPRRGDRAAARRCSPSPSRPAPRPTRTSSGRPSTACRRRTRRSCSSATTRPTRRCCGASARPTWRSPSSGCSASSASTSTPRTSGSPTARRSRPTPRPRASTRSRRAATASSAWPSCGSSRSPRGDGLRVRRQDRRRRHPPPVHPRGGEGHRGDDGARRGATASPSSTSGSTCFDGKYHSVDSSEMSFKMAGSLGFKEAMAKAEPGRARADLAAQGHRARRVPGRRDGRPQRPARAGAGHRVGRRRRAADHRPRADVGDHALRHRPALDDRRPRPLHRRRTTTTTRCRRTSSTSWRRPRLRPTERSLTFRRGRRRAFVRARRLRETLAAVTPTEASAPSTIGSLARAVAAGPR